MPLHAAVDVIHNLLEWVFDCVNTRYEGAPATIDQGDDQDPLRAMTPPTSVDMMDESVEAEPFSEAEPEPATVMHSSRDLAR